MIQSKQDGKARFKEREIEILKSRLGNLETNGEISQLKQELHNAKQELHSARVKNKGNDARRVHDAEKIIEAIRFYRGALLAILECQAASDEEWKKTRQLLLNSLGEGGICGQVRRILNAPRAARIEQADEGK